MGTGIYIDGVDEDMRHVQFGIWTGLLVILGLSVLVTGLVSRFITRPVKEVVETIKDIAQGEGDLTKRLPISGNNEIGELSEWFNTFVHKLHGIIS